MSAFYLSAAHKSSGKTTISIALGAAFAARGLRVSAFKKGPDYIDPLWLSSACQSPCYNLDFNTQTQAEILRLFAARSQGADVAFVEGNKGLFDGMDMLGSDCNAAMAALLQLPVLLVLDVQGSTRGVVPLLRGYRDFAGQLDIAGVIFNKVGGSRHEAKLRQVVTHYTDLAILGAVQKHADFVIEERHLGLVPSNEQRTAEQHIARLSAAIGDQVDLDEIQRMGRALPTDHATAAPTSAASDVTIAVARDAAFGFYYADDLEAFSRAGARLVFFSPLVDARVPTADGLFIGGGFPETHMQALASNHSMLQSVRDFIDGSGPAYAECGGLMYLARSLQWQGKVGRMAGVIQADAVMYARPQGRGYTRVQVASDHPWPGVAGGELPLHEFHYSRLENLQPDYRFAYGIQRGEGIDGQHDGLIYRNLVAAYLHQRDVEGNRWVGRFVDFVRLCKSRAR
jgi:cobyrinic acid a,c-diamide synthase